MDESPLPQQNIFYFDHINDDGKSYKIRFNSVFDSGNLRQVFSPSQSTYTIYTAPDCCGTEYEGTAKSWYYFGVKGVPQGATLNFTIKRISILYAVFKSQPDAYRPVYKINEDGPWNRIEEKAMVVEDPIDKTIDVKFSFTFNNLEKDELFFAFSYPFSYQENKKLLDKYDTIFQEDSDIYYYRELLIKSPQERDIELVTITSHEGKQAENESFINENMFPLRADKQRARKFRLNKPVVLITARVHPGETPASHTMNGMLEFLLDKKDVRAKLLRTYFTFMLVPMINPDGVANGHYRMDAYNQNLNRYYKNPDLKKQPACYAIKELVEHLNSEDRLFFYCDLHAHAARKGCFLYGNALDFVMQVESILFAKILAVNCINFEYESSNFSKKHMNARDRGEKLTKEGAGRVCVYKIGNLIHSYTLECGLHFSNQLNRIIMPSSNKEWYEDEVSDINSPMYKDSPTYYNIKIYENLGKGILVSILDTFEKNPCTRLLSSNCGTLEDLRKEVAARVIKIPRFWKEAGVKKKCLKINEIVREVFYDDFHKRNVFSINLKLRNNITQLTTRRIQNALTQLPTTTAKAKRKHLSNYSSKTNAPTTAILEWEQDENTENDAEQQALPKLKTAVAPKEFRIRSGDTKITSIEKLQQKGEETTLAISEKRTLLQQSLKGPDKEALLLEYNSLQEIQTPTRSIIFSKEGTQVLYQSGLLQGQVENSMKSLKKVPMGKDYTGKIMKSSDKKRVTTLLKLPELEKVDTASEVQSIANPSFVILGNRNYLISKRNNSMKKGK